MVCKNCGAELKPGVMYCLECGSYIEDNEDFADGVATSENDSTNSSSVKRPPIVKKKKKYKVKLSLKDWLIYGGLFLILIGSIIVIVITLINGSKKEEVIQPVPQQQTPVVVKQDQTYTIDNYTVVVTKEFSSDVKNDMLYVADDRNFTLNFQITSDDIEKDLKDIKSLYEVIETYEKTSGTRKFTICKIKVNGLIKYFYLSKIDDKYSAMGVIEELADNKWEEALPALDKVINSVKIDDTEETTKTVDKTATSNNQ